MDSISPPNRPHYPWKQGEILIADELNAAIANAGHGGGMRVTDWLPGGQPDGVTDLSLYFQEAIDAAADVDLVNSNRSAAPGLTRFIVPANPIPYTLGAPLHVPSNSHIIIELGATLKAIPTLGVVPVPAQYGGGFLFNPDVPGTIIENVIIELYGTLDGDWLNQAGDIGGLGPIGAGVQGGIAGGPCNNVYIYGNRQGVITRIKNWPINLSHCSNSEVRGLNVSYCGNTVHFAGTSTRVNVVVDPASNYTVSSGVISFKCDAPHGINVGDTFSFTAAVAPSQYLQGEYVAVTVPDAYTVTGHVAVPTVGNGPILGGKIGYANPCYNVHIVDCLVEYISDLAVVLYSGCHHSSIRNCEVRYCASSGPTIFSDVAQPASCSDCEVSGCYVHDNQGGGTGSTSNQYGIFHKNVRVFNNVIHDNLAGGLVVAAADGISVSGNEVHNCTQVSAAHQTSSVAIAPTALKANVWGNTIRDPGKSVLSVTVALGTLINYNSTTGAVSLQTLTPPLSSGVPKAHNINVGDQFNLAIAVGTGDCTKLNGWQTATAGTTGSTLNFTVAPGLVFTLVRINLRGFTYAVPRSHIVPATYTSDANGNISVQTYQTTLGDGLPHGYPVGAWFVVDQVLGSPPGTGGATDYAGLILNGQQLATAGTASNTLNFIVTPNATVVVTNGGRVLPANFGIMIAGLDEADVSGTSPGTGPDYLRLSGNRMGDYQAPRNMVCAIGGVWGLNGAADGNYFGPRVGIDPDVSDYNKSGVSGFNYDLVYNNAPVNMLVTGMVTFGPPGGISTKYLPPQGLTPSWNYRVGRGEVDFFCGPGGGAPGGFEFFQVQVIHVAATGSTYDPVTGIVTLITVIPHTVLPGGTFSLNNPTGTDGTDTGTDDVLRIRGARTANSDTTGTTLTFNAALNMTIITINGGIVVPAHTGGGLVNTSVGVAGSLMANDGFGNTRFGGALVHGAIQTATLANGGTVTVPQNTSFMLVQNASSIAAGSLVLPAPQASSYQTIGSELTVRFQNPVGTLTVTAATGAAVAGPPTTVLSGGTAFRFIQGGSSAPNTWLPCLPNVSGGSGGSGGSTVISTVIVPTVTANSITVPAGTNYVVVQDSVNAVNTLTVGSGTIADGYDLWMNFPNGGTFAGQFVSAHGNLTLKVLGGGWSILSKFG